MAQAIDEVLLEPGNSIPFADRDDLLEKLDHLDRRLPGGKRRRERKAKHREHYCIVRYLRFLAGADLLPLPVTLTKTAEGHDPPDFTLSWSDGRTEAPSAATAISTYSSNSSPALGSRSSTWRAWSAN